MFILDLLLHFESTQSQNTVNFTDILLYNGRAQVSTVFNFGALQNGVFHSFVLHNQLKVNYFLCMFAHFKFCVFRNVFSDSF